MGLNLKFEPKFNAAPEPKRVVFADFAVAKYQPVSQLLMDQGVVVEMVTEPPKFLSLIANHPYDVCVINLLLGGLGPFELIRQVRATSKNPDLKVIVTSRQVQRQNIQNAVQAGAHDFIAEPFENEDICGRILYHLTPKQIVETRGFEKSKPGDDAWEYVNLLLESVETLSRTPRQQDHGAFLGILQKIANLTKSNRSSLIIVDSESNTGVVLASSDDPSFYDFPIALHKYPEVLHVMNTGHFVLVEDVSQNSLTHSISEKVRTILIGSLMVFPVHFQNEIVGVLTIRRPQAQDLPSPQVLRVLQSVANTMASHSNVKALLRRLYKDFSESKKMVR